MIKKITLASLLITAIFSANAQERKSGSSGRKMIKNGFYLNVGLAFPSMTVTPTEYTSESGGNSVTTSAPSGSTGSSLSLGIQPNIEIGNQWYFYKKEKWGIGLRVSWFQFGYSSFTINKGTSSENSFGNVDLRFIKLAPQFSYAIAPKMALDFSFEFSPTVMIGAASKNNVTEAYAAVGLLFAPGVKFRYDIFAVGFDLGFGSPAFADVTTDNSSSSTSKFTIKGNAAILYPRIYIGLKF